MNRYVETKSRRSVTKDRHIGRGVHKVEVKTTIPPNTCHPGERVEFHSLAKPPVWKCAKCGGVLVIEKEVNRAVILEG